MDDGTPMRQRADAITAVGIVTRGRAERLCACIESYMENCRNHERTPEFIVTDDSTDGDPRTRSALQRLRSLGTASVSYGGRAERIGFAEALARAASVPIDMIRFGLIGDARCPLTTGANRNSLLLDTLDLLVLSVDDDTRCRIAAVQEGEAHLTSFTGYDPTDFWFFPDRRRALDSVAFVDADVLGCHEAMLGRRLSDESGVSVTITLQGVVGDAYIAGQIIGELTALRMPTSLKSQYDALKRMGLPYVPVVTHLALAMWSMMHGMTSLFIYGYFTGFLGAQVEPFVDLEIEKMIQILGLTS